MPSYSLSTSFDAFALDDRFRFARSHAVRRRRTARVPADVLLVLPLELVEDVTIRLSKSSPPRCVSSEITRTSNSPSSVVSSKTSNVPHPTSKIRMFFSPDEPLSSPYAIAAAVGSLMIRVTFRTQSARVLRRPPLQVVEVSGNVKTAFLTFATVGFFAASPVISSSVANATFKSCESPPSSFINCLLFPNLSKPQYIVIF